MCDHQGIEICDHRQGRELCDRQDGEMCRSEAGSSSCHWGDSVQRRGMLACPGQCEVATADSADQVQRLRDRLADQVLLQEGLHRNVVRHFLYIYIYLLNQSTPGFGFLYV